MGYQLVTNTDGESLSDEGWMDLIALASKHGFSAPRLSHLGGYEEAYLTEEEAEGLYAALERALFAGEPAEHIAPEDDALDRVTVRRVGHVLQKPERKMLRRTPPSGAKRLPFEPVLGHPRAPEATIKGPERWCDLRPAAGPEWNDVP